MKVHLFDWPSRHQVHVVLPLMLVFSLLLHIAGVLVFQITYPRSSSRLPRYGEVFYLQPGSPEAARLMPLIEANDPALFSPGQVFGRDVWRVPDTTYEASFDAERPALESLPRPAKDSFLPPVSSSEPVGDGAAAPSPGARSVPGPDTVVRLGDGLKDRTLTPPEGGLHFPALPRQGLIPVEFLVAVSPEGVPLHIFLVNRGADHGSGNEAFDRAALHYLSGSRFSPVSGDETAWGTATFYWGADIPRQQEP